MKAMTRQAKAYEGFFDKLLTAADILFRRTKKFFEQQKESQENTQEACKASKALFCMFVGQTLLLTKKGQRIILPILGRTS